MISVFICFLTCNKSAKNKIKPIKPTNRIVKDVNLNNCEIVPTNVRSRSDVLRLEVIVIKILSNKPRFLKMENTLKTGYIEKAIKRNIRP